MHERACECGADLEGPDCERFSIPLLKVSGWMENDLLVHQLRYCGDLHSDALLRTRVLREVGPGRAL